MAEAANEAEQEAASLPDGNADTVPGSPGDSDDRACHPTRRHCDPVPHASDGDRGGMSPASTGHQDTTRTAADASGYLPNRGGGRPPSGSQRETETAGESRDGAAGRSADLTEASSNGQQRARRLAPHLSGCKRDSP